jgi:NitT/TauT family transport system ATP-binding protein
MNATSPAIDLHQITKRIYSKNGAEIEILKPIDLQVQQGEFLALVGPSGCGKSTLLNICAGLTPFTSGQLMVAPNPNTGAKAKLGYMFQTDSLLPWRTILKNVQCGLDFDGLEKNLAESQARQMIQQLGLAGFENHYPSELSGGMRQRASLARTWVTNPDILLMDEPFGALDSQTKQLIQELFLAFWEEHRKTVVLVTHDIDEALLMADRVIVMSARPGCFKSSYQINFPRPRVVEDIRSRPEFVDYRRQIWNDLKQEALQTMGKTSS